MSLINKIYLSCAHGMLKGLDRTRKYPFEVQKEVFTTLLKGGADTIFGSEHGFSKISSIQDFQRQVPVRDYNALYPYIERLRFGENYVLWNEKTHFLLKARVRVPARASLSPLLIPTYGSVITEGCCECWPIMCNIIRTHEFIPASQSLWEAA